MPVPLVLNEPSGSTVSNCRIVNPCGIRIAAAIPSGSCASNFRSKLWPNGIRTEHAHQTHWVRSIYDERKNFENNNDNFTKNCSNCFGPSIILLINPKTVSHKSPKMPVPPQSTAEAKHFQNASEKSPTIPSVS